jgi:hypothetical protein
MCPKARQNAAPRFNLSEMCRGTGQSYVADKQEFAAAAESCGGHGREYRHR